MIYIGKYVVDPDHPEYHDDILVLKMTECTVNKKDYVIYSLLCSDIDPNDYKNGLYSAEQTGSFTVEITVPSVRNKTMNNHEAMRKLLEASGPFQERRGKEYEAFVAAMNGDKKRLTKKIELEFPDVVSAEPELPTPKGTALMGIFDIQPLKGGKAFVAKVEWMVYVPSSGRVTTLPEKGKSFSDKVSEKMKALGLDSDDEDSMGG